MKEITDLIRKDRITYESKLNAWTFGDIIKKPKVKPRGYNPFQKTVVGIIFTALSFFGCNPILYEEPPPTEATAKPSQTPTNEPTEEPTAKPTAEPENYIHISGNVEDNKTHTRQEALIQIYDTKNPDNSYSNFLGEFSTNSSGNFAITLDKLVNPEDKIYLRARTGSSWEDENADSYIRTIELDAVDNNPITVPTGNPAIRVWSYPNFDTNNDGKIDKTDYWNFREHMKETNISQHVLSDGKELGLRKFDLENLEKIQIFRDNPDGKGSFIDMEIIKNIIKTNEGIETVLPNGMQLDDYIEIVEGCPPFGIKPNYIYFYPDNSIVEGRVTPSYLNGTILTGIVNGGKIRINPNTSHMRGTINHELGHLFIAPNGEAYTLSKDLTIMYPYVGGIIDPGIADTEASGIYEYTYQPRETLDDVLGMNSSGTDSKYTSQARDISYNLSEMNKGSLDNSAN
jgi:hypothetical protein